MYKHEVIGIRREDSWRSRESEHIVGMCTLEAVDADGRFENFDPKEDWRAVDGQLVLEQGTKSHASLTPVCRYWSLEEVLEAMRRATPRHEFYTREPKKGQTKIPVFSYLGNATDLYTVDQNGKEVQVYWDGNKSQLYTKNGSKRQPFRSSGALFVRDPRTGGCRAVELRDGALIARNANGSAEEVECRAGDVRWVKTLGSKTTPGNPHSKTPGSLHSLRETPADCPQVRCTVIPRAARPVSRGYDGSDF